ncbi:hypothetical protein DAETH_48560 (plasmid) [Deinococcus aetherius]|uniref:Uncharacterized protein n=1 Tax=Deinococcus aetherius TaxID=200252 RepID=A0ABM8AM08_9DEIO|nr:hypothetical protein [Deinococcus aetherius]BDP44887.1 hypothetical protein DAETH_48560 [Deinococcus aetherius]
MTHDPSRLARLRRLHFLASVHELMAEPCTPERRVRGRRVDRIAEAVRGEHARHAQDGRCELCGGHAHEAVCGECGLGEDRYLAESAAAARRGRRQPFMRAVMSALAGPVEAPGVEELRAAWKAAALAHEADPSPENDALEETAYLAMVRAGGL